MKNTRAALRYAKAVLSTSLDGRKSAVAKDMQTIRATFAENSELLSFLENPVIPNATKQETLTKVFSYLDVLSSQLIDLLTRNNRIDLDQVATAYLTLLESTKEKKP